MNWLERLRFVLNKFSSAQPTSPWPSWHLRCDAKFWCRCSSLATEPLRPSSNSFQHFCCGLTSPLQVYLQLSDQRIPSKAILAGRRPQYGKRNIANSAPTLKFRQAALTAKRVLNIESLDVWTKIALRMIRLWVGSEEFTVHWYLTILM